MNGFRIALYLAYAIFILFAVGLLVAGVWFAQQTFDTAVALLATATPTELAVETVAPTAVGTTTEPAPSPTATRVPPRTATPTPDTSCIASSQAKQHFGETLCVQGVVVRTYSTNTAFFVEFDQPSTGFFGSVLNPSAPLTNLEGKCIQLNGKLQNFQGRPFILFKPEEMQNCPNP